GTAPADDVPRLDIEYDLAIGIRGDVEKQFKIDAGDGYGICFFFSLKIDSQAIVEGHEVDELFGFGSLITTNRDKDTGVLFRPCVGCYRHVPYRTRELHISGGISLSIE